MPLPSDSCHECKKKIFLKDNELERHQCTSITILAVSTSSQCVGNASSFLWSLIMSCHLANFDAVVAISLHIITNSQSRKIKWYTSTIVAVKCGTLKENNQAFLSWCESLAVCQHLSDATYMLTSINKQNETRKQHGHNMLRFRVNYQMLRCSEITTEM